MDIKTKYDIGEKVYYFDANKGRIWKGEVESIEMSFSMFERDVIYHIRNEEILGIRSTEPVRQYFVFKNREEIVDFCNELMQGV